MISFLPIRAAKELRELFPWWAATVVGVVVCSNISRLLPFSLGKGPFAAASVMIYIAGAVALGALSLGHEYSNRTLGALLTQPIDRRRILATKIAVVAPLLLVLIPIAGFIFRDDERPYLMSTVWALVSLPVLFGLSLAPWLTMVCRSALAGTVFAIALPFFVFVASMIAGHNGFAELLLTGLLVGVLGAVGAWRTFMRLEAIDGPQAEIDVAGWLRRQSSDQAAPTLARSPVWLLVKKELRLQQMTLLISTLFVAIWVVTLTWRRVVPDFQGPDLFSTAIMHGPFVVMVAGALASAEERQLGTMAWQSLMPMATWRQWAIKAGVVMTLGFALAVGLPMWLRSMAPDGNNFPVDRGLMFPVAMISASALYVSSLNSSGMRAILALFPVAAGAALVSGVVLFPLGKTAARLFRPYAEHVTPFVFNSYSEFRHWDDVVSAGVMTPLALGFVWLILAFGLANHRSADRSTLRIRWQVNWIVLYALVATVLLYLLSELLRAGLHR